MLPLLRSGKTRMLAVPLRHPLGAFWAATLGTRAASAWSSPSTTASRPISFTRSLHFWAATTIFSMMGSEALPLVEQLRKATRGCLSRSWRQVLAVARAMSTTPSASGLMLTPQSAKRRVFSPLGAGVFKSMMKQEEALLMPGAVPMQWKALRSMSAVEAMEPATMASPLPDFSMRLAK